MKLLPQKFIPLVWPVGSASCPVRLTAITGRPLATACPRCMVVQASRWRSCSSGVSVLS